MLVRSEWGTELVQGGFFGGRLAKEPGCTGGICHVAFTGKPNDRDFQQWLIAAELQHAADHECMVNRDLKGYESDVHALPSVIPAGYLGFGDCATRLEERLNRVARYNTMIKEYEAKGLSHDSPASPGREGGPHLPTFKVDTDAGCAHITVTMTSKSLSPPGEPCEPRTPP
jgi:hypothetical protein